MANPLQRGNVPPPPPDLSERGAQPQSPMGPMPSNPMMVGASLQPNPAAAPQAPVAPAPTHSQTVAGLRHFGALLGELETLRANPNLGKADIKKDIIEGVTKLVADQFMTADKAVAELGTVPERPYEQKMWVMNHLANVMRAAAGMLDHHRAAFPGSLDYAQESAMAADPNNHSADMDGLMGHYQQQTVH